MEPWGVPEDPVAGRLDREARLIESAVRLVASGAATAAVVAGLQCAAAAAAIVADGGPWADVIIDVRPGPDGIARAVLVRTAPTLGPA